MPQSVGRRPWTGSWVTERIGVHLRTTEASYGYAVEDLVGLALRRNPRRAHLLVSGVLGKHVPADPRLVRSVGLLLGDQVRALLGETSQAPVVLGYAETATGLGHCVADALGDADYLHSTRRRAEAVVPVGGFEEEHSHATAHLLLPRDPAWLTRPGPLVLVDDELSTGTTVLNTVRALRRLSARTLYVAATLVDVRSAGDRARLDAEAAAMGVRIDVVALARGELHLPTGLPTFAADATAAAEPDASGRHAGGSPRKRQADAVASSREVGVGWPRGLPVTARHGWTPGDRRRLDAALPRLAANLVSALEPLDDGASRPTRVLVLGTEELMYVPIRLAAALADHAVGAVDVRVSSTTRSPAVAFDDPGYPLRDRIVFTAHDQPVDGPGERFAYNVATAFDGVPPDVVVLVVDDAGDTAALRAPDGLLDQLGDLADVLVMVLPDGVPDGVPDDLSDDLPDGRGGGASDSRPVPEPLRGPRFGSYAADEVGWLLTDLSGASLEAPTEEREEAIQSGGAHYAESLPIEYVPGPEYHRLFRSALDASAKRLAHEVGLVTELVIAERGPGTVLVSLARAGTPIGVLMRRWAAQRRGIDLPHYSISIVRGRGIDTVALRWLAAHHNPAAVMFVDGWTGKGAIVAELRAALNRHAERSGDRFDPTVAVVADPAGSATVFASRDDYLIPSACLNSTVSGLVSRTVLNRDLLLPGDFHGAKFYADLAPADLSALFVDTVSSRFAEVADQVDADLPAVRYSDRAPTEAGLAAVRRISEDYGIHDVNLVKPGIGETTRVLLRRVPWRILARADTGNELAHVRALADERGVPVEDVTDLAYRCVGLIHPRFTRGVTGPDGRGVTR